MNTGESSALPRGALPSACAPGDLSRAVLISDPLTFAQIALARDGAGNFQFPDLGVRGGSAIGIPALASNGSPRDSSGGILTLLDPDGVVLGDGGLVIDRSAQASLQMLDNPTTNSSTGTPTTNVSLFQVDSHAIKAERVTNWAVARPSVSLVTGASY